jgi:hypothetical protein
MFSACAAQIMNAVRGDCVKVLKQSRFLYTRYYIGLLRALTRPIFLSVFRYWQYYWACEENIEGIEHKRYSRNWIDGSQYIYSVGN